MIICHSHKPNFVAQTGYLYSISLPYISLYYIVLYYRNVYFTTLIYRNKDGRQLRCWSLKILRGRSYHQSLCLPRQYRDAGSRVLVLACPATLRRPHKCDDNHLMNSYLLNRVYLYQCCCSISTLQGGLFPMPYYYLWTIPYRW